MKLDANRVAIVTGASRGIGRAIAIALAQKGVRVLAAARSREGLAAVSADVERHGSECSAAVCDVGSWPDVAAAVQQALDRFGRIDIVINNAGFGSYAPFLDADLQEFHELMRVNYFGSVYVTRAALPAMLRQGGGHLVFVASVAGRIASPRHTGYSPTKFAVVGFAESIAYELGPHKIGVTIVNPGIVDTDFFGRDSFKDFPEVPRKMMVSAEVVARATIAAIRWNRAEVYVPRSLRYAHMLKVLAPSLFRAGSMRYARRHGMIPSISVPPVSSG
jgi:hypothetical protein